MHRHGMNNGKNGHCWVYVPMQAYAVDGGWPALVESAFSHKRSDRLYNLCGSARSLAVAVLDVSLDPVIIGARNMKGPRVATDPDLTRRLALNYDVDIDNPVDLRDTMLYMDPILGGGGHGGTEAVRALAEGLGIELLIGEEVDVDAEYIKGSTKRMALHDPGHWSLQVFMVS